VNTEDAFSSAGRQAFRFILDAIGTQNEAARIMDVGIATVSRWADTRPTDPFGRRTPRSWRSSWFGYPAPLPSLDRICERVRGRDFLSSLCERRAIETGPVLEALRTEGLNLLEVVSYEEASLACRQLKIPDSTRHRLLLQGEWPSQWAALDRLSRKVALKGWPEFVLGSVELDAPREPLPVAAIQCLLRPVRLKVKSRGHRLGRDGG